ncbi:MAG: hypothetical protein JXJ04_19575 [Spirochaetales bacterium]|nr:hypothetical protein [Spirochaetales bacterium]
MVGKDYFTITEISEICMIESDFVRELIGFGIIEVHKQENFEYVNPETIDVLKMAKRLYFDLGVNKEGIDIILSMRHQILDLQEEVEGLHNKVDQLTNEQKYRNLEMIIDQGLLFDI